MILNARALFPENSFADVYDDLFKLFQTVLIATETHDICDNYQKEDHSYYEKTVHFYFSVRNMYFQPIVMFKSYWGGRKSPKTCRTRNFCSHSH